MKIIYIYIHPPPSPHGGPGFWMTWEAMHKKLVLLCKYHKNSEGSMAQHNHGTSRSLPKNPWRMHSVAVVVVGWGGRWFGWFGGGFPARRPRRFRSHFRSATHPPSASAYRPPTVLLRQPPNSPTVVGSGGLNIFDQSVNHPTVVGSGGLWWFGGLVGWGWLRGWWCNIVDSPGIFGRLLLVP